MEPLLKLLQSLQGVHNMPLRYPFEFIKTRLSDKRAPFERVLLCPRAPPNEEHGSEEGHEEADGQVASDQHTQLQVEDDSAGSDGQFRPESYHDVSDMESDAEIGVIVARTEVERQAAIENRD